MTLRHVGGGLYEAPGGRWSLLKDTAHPDPTERGWFLQDAGMPVGPVFRSRPEALAWVQAKMENSLRMG